MINIQERFKTYEDFFRIATNTDSGPTRSPYEYQKLLGESPICSRAIHIPTGSGKTAAVVLAWLWNRLTRPDETPRRLVYCLPMRVLVEQIASEVCKWIKVLGLDVKGHVLMGGVSAEDWAINLDEPMILVGTQDMLLSRALNRGYAMIRYQWPMQFGLLNNDAVWVLDEVQLMGDGLTTSCQLAAFRERFGVFGRCPTIWMSATMDSAMLKSIDVAEPPEMFTLPAEDYKRKDLGERLRASKRISKAPDICRRPAGLAEFLAASHRAGTQTIAVVNRVGRARETYDHLRTIAPEIPCTLLHSRFRPEERKLWHSMLSTSPPPTGRILIATQVIEAGVDISSALLVTDLAPWASLVQRFGRCNRAGEFTAADIFWVDRPLFSKSKLPESGELSSEIALPYEVDELLTAESRVSELTSASPANLPKYDVYFAPTHVLRRRDLLDLFDTMPDLSGYDLDISRFIRSEQDRDVLIAWRDSYPPLTKKDAPAPQELCPTPIHEVEALLKIAKKGLPRFEIRTWNALESEWVSVAADALRPGMVLIASTKSGGYDKERGWDPESTTAVTEVSIVKREEEGDPDDPGTFLKYVQTLEAHSREVHEMMRSIIETLATLSLDDYQEDLLLAALHHDWGKAHPVFQATVNPDGTGPLLAKSKREGRHKRKHFRHELASALAMLQNNAPDLAVYLTAAHHGKVRLSIRALPGETKPKDSDARFARGIHDGDILPHTQLSDVAVAAITLDLEPMLLGSGQGGNASWTDRMVELRDKLGVFRLAYLEALIVAADWRASKTPTDVLA